VRFRRATTKEIIADVRQDLGLAIIGIAVVIAVFKFVHTLKRRLEICRNL